MDNYDESFKKYVNKYKRELRLLYKEKEAWESVYNSGKDIISCAKELELIKKKIKFWTLAFLTNAIDLNEIQG